MGHFTNNSDCPITMEVSSVLSCLVASPFWQPASRVFQKKPASILMTSPSISSFFFLISCLFAPELSLATDTITVAQPLKDPSSLLSSNGVFKLGFVTPQGSKNRYLGIWYNKASQDIVWVANRDKPLADSSGALSIASNGTLQLVDGENQTVWTWSPGSLTSAASARLLDSGSLVVAGSDVWPSFDSPSDSFVPDTTFRYSTTSSSNGTFLRSWKSNADASEGRYSVGIDSISVPQIVISEDGNIRPRWRSGPWNGNSFVGLQDNINSNDGATNGFILDTDRRSYVSLSFNVSGGSANSFLANYKLTDQGILVLQRWDDGKKNWESAWQAPQSKCDAYGLCGAYASCNPQSSTPICQCLKGFVPKNQTEWSNGNWTSGCTRRIKLQQCGGSISSSSSGGVGDGFWTVNSVKVPDKADWLLGLNSDECKSQCLNNCTCYAYVYDTGAGCLSWSKDLIDTVEISDGGGMDLNLRLSGSELKHGTSSKAKIIGAVAGVLVVLVLAPCIFFLWRRMARKKGKTIRTHTNVFEGRTDVELEELPLFALEKLVTATNDFDMRNKLGQGGFGPVYKGTLEDGQEIAVKRLSRASGQGLHEFMNEVGLISKLQHRNLVRLLGCCAEGEEKMLVYEYMPNKSLDAFLFDPQKRVLLDWAKRLNIIQGICRGLLYLHRDSRLKIIHRDLKASNILLDENLNPKISDFGMARIFGGTQDQENTTRVVGTYGYMAPEYAMEGKFSEKSDVFSFGVLLLEIVSGRKNTSFSLSEHSLSLIAHAWNLWNEQNVASLIDPTIVDTCYLGEILKCIRVGLLCVQEFAKDRPSISRLMFFLGSETADIPTPMPPGFVLRQMQVYSTSGEGSSSVQGQQQQSSSCSVYGDDPSITVLVGR